MKNHNDYTRALSRYPGMFDAIPKTVFAAIAYSFALKETEGKGVSEAVNALMNEWETLYTNGIIPQRPTAWILQNPRAEDPTK